jgi:hypothetical protein
MDWQTVSPPDGHRRRRRQKGFFFRTGIVMLLVRREERGRNMDYPFRVQSEGTSARRAAVIRAHSDAAAAAPPQAGADVAQQYLARVMKLIPAEIVALYQGCYGIVNGAVQSNDEFAKSFIGWMPWIALLLLVFVRSWGTRDSTGSWKTVQWGAVLISSISFGVWVVSLGHSIELVGEAKPWIGSLLLIIWPFLVPFFYKGN